MPMPEQIEVRGLADHLEVMTKVAFQSGLSWRVVEAKWDGFRDAFGGFDPEFVAGLHPSDVDRLAADPRIIRNRRKIEATIANAAELLEFGDEASFRNWLRSHDDHRATVRAIRSRFGYLGPTGIRYFLHVIGEEVPGPEEATA